MPKSSTLRTNGGVWAHAVDRLVGQYGFRGSRKEARKLLRKCREEADKEDRVLISSKNLGIASAELLRWGIPDCSLIAIISRGEVVSVIS